MESCVPLMTVKYLPVRSILYTSTCICYYAIQQPLQAEVRILDVAVVDDATLQLFARRSLDKVHQLAQIEYLTSTTESSTVIFTEATIKVMM